MNVLQHYREGERLLANMSHMASGIEGRMLVVQTAQAHFAAAQVGLLALATQDHVASSDARAYMAAFSPSYVPAAERRRLDAEDLNACGSDTGETR